MSINILMPALSPTMFEGNLVKWLKKEGDTIKAGQILCEIETDKATMEVEAVDEGILGRIFIPEGSENIQVNTCIAVLLEKGEDISSIKTEKTAVFTTLTPETKEEKEEEDPKTSYNTEQKTDNRVFASPLAKRIMTQNNLDPETLKGSGPHGRIVKKDVIQKLESKITLSKPDIKLNTPSFYEDIKVSLMRKTVARRLTESKNTVPHFYLTLDVELDSLLTLRSQINEAQETKISVNDMIIKACAKSLIDVPKANVTWHETHLRYYESADISVAVAIDGGLVTPIIFNAEKLSVIEIAHTTKILIEKAKLGKLQPKEYEGGNFSLSNLGMYGIKNFQAIINPPQGCILAVGSGEKRVIVKNNAPFISTMMSVSLSVDHRSVDGALGAEFLKVFKKYIENPVLILV